MAVTGRPNCLCRGARRQQPTATPPQLAAAAGDENAEVFADEVHMYLNPKLCLGWMPPGTERLVVTPANNQKPCLVGGCEP